MLYESPDESYWDRGVMLDGSASGEKIPSEIHQFLLSLQRLYEQSLLDSL